MLADPDAAADGRGDGPGRRPADDHPGPAGPAAVCGSSTGRRCTTRASSWSWTADLSADSDPYLADHLLDGDLLFPAVLGMEAMAQAAVALTGASGRRCWRTWSSCGRSSCRSMRPTTIRVAALVTGHGDGPGGDPRRGHRLPGRPLPRDPAVSADRRRRTPGRRHRGRPGRSPIDPGRDLYGPVLFQGGRFQRLLRYRQLAATRLCRGDRQPAGGTVVRRAPARRAGAGRPGHQGRVMHAIQCCVPDATLLPAAVERLYLADPAAAADRRRGHPARGRALPRRRHLRLRPRRPRSGRPAGGALGGPAAAGGAQAGRLRTVAARAARPVPGAPHPGGAAHRAARAWCDPTATEPAAPTAGRDGTGGGTGADGGGRVRCGTGRTASRNGRRRTAAAMSAAHGAGVTFAGRAGERRHGRLRRRGAPPTGPDEDWVRPARRRTATPWPCCSPTSAASTLVGGRHPGLGRGGMPAQERQGTGRRRLTAGRAGAGRLGLLRSGTAQDRDVPDPAARRRRPGGVHHARREGED